MAITKKAAENTKESDHTTDNLEANATVDSQVHDDGNASEVARVTGILNLPDEILLKIVKHLLPTQSVYHFFPARITDQRSRPIGTKVQKLAKKLPTSTGRRYDDPTKDVAWIRVQKPAKGSPTPFGRRSGDPFQLSAYARTCKRFKEVCYSVRYGENHFVLELATTALDWDVTGNGDTTHAAPFGYPPDIIWPFSTGVSEYIKELTILVTVDPSPWSTSRRKIKEQFNEMVKVFSSSKKLRYLTIDVRRTDDRHLRIDRLPKRLTWNDSNMKRPILILKQACPITRGSSTSRDFIEILGPLANVEHLVLSAGQERVMGSITSYEEVLRALTSPSA